MTAEIEAAWLAGFWDGEGSVGLHRRSAVSYHLNAQLSHTDFPTVVHVMSLLDNLGIARRGYTYEERDPAKHRPAHYLRITSSASVHRLALALHPYAVTKRRHWEVAIAWYERRVEIAGGLDTHGRLKRGGDWRNRLRAYTHLDLSMVAELSTLNHRGPVQ